MAKRKLTRNDRAFVRNPRSFIKKNAIVPLAITIVDSTLVEQTIFIDPRSEQFLDQNLDSGGSIAVRPRDFPGVDLP